MASYHQLKRDMANHLPRLVYLAVQKSENARIVEESAAAVIQSLVRMVFYRRKFVRIRLACIHIQRVFRGYRARLYALDHAISRTTEHQHLFFTHFAVLIQKTWRAFFSRKWKSNFYELKTYIKNVTATSDAVRLKCSEFFQECTEADNQRNAISVQEKFFGAASNLHHLVSTKAAPGIFRDVTTGLPTQTIFNTSIEDVLKSQKISKERRSPKLLPPIISPSSNSAVISLQATSKYDIVKDCMKMERKLDKLTRIPSLKSKKAQEFADASLYLSTAAPACHFRH